MEILILEREDVILAVIILKAKLSENNRTISNVAALIVWKPQWNLKVYWNLMWAPFFVRRLQLINATGVL